jgi:hypothetical protein
VALSSLEERVVLDLSSGNFRFTLHAIGRSMGRGISFADIQSAAREYLDCWTDKDEVVHVVGPDLDQDEIEIRAAYDGQTVVITVVGLN